MKRTSILCIALLSGLTGCAMQPTTPAYSANQVQAIKQDRLTTLSHCLITNVQTLDDGVSDAQTIARALAGACYPQFEAVAEIQGYGMSPDAYPRFLKRVRREYPNQALPVVLNYRRVTGR